MLRQNALQTLLSSVVAAREERNRPRPRNGNRRQLRSVGRPPRQLDQLSGQVATSTAEPDARPLRSGGARGARRRCLHPQGSRRQPAHRLVGLGAAHLARRHDAHPEHTERLLAKLSWARIGRRPFLNILAFITDKFKNVAHGEGDICVGNVFYAPFMEPLRYAALHSGQRLTPSPAPEAARTPRR